MQHGDKSRYNKRPNSSGNGGGGGGSSRVRMSWMFPVLAIMSIFMNGSMHFRRTRGVSGIERGPPSTKQPKQAPAQRLTRIGDDGSSKGVNELVGRSKLSETIRKQIEEAATNDQTRTTSRTTRRKTQPKLKVSDVTESRNVVQKKKETGIESASDNTNDHDSTQQEKTSKVAATTTSKMLNLRKVINPREVSEASLSPDVTFSACLLIRDDNDIINEWIAYHYHVLRMKRLIVGVDPNSETSPEKILTEWTDLMEIDLWTDADYMPKEFLRTGIPPKDHIQNITKFGEINHEVNLGINAHRYRQKVFLTQCFKKLKVEKRTWAMHIDTDEYIVPSKNHYHF